MRTLFRNESAIRQRTEAQQRVRQAAGTDNPLADRGFHITATC